MVVIDIHYKLFRPLPWYKDLKIKIPIHWEDLSCKQLVALPEDEFIEINDYEKMCSFLKLDEKLKKHITTNQWSQIFMSLKFLQEPEPVGRFIIRKIIDLNAAEFDQLTFGAFIYGDTYFSNYLAGYDEDLCRFIACFYYGRNFFDVHLIDNNAMRIRLGCDKKTLGAIATNYGLIREWLGEKYPKMFMSGKNRPDLCKKTERTYIFCLSNIITDKGKKRIVPGDDIGWFETMNSLENCLGLKKGETLNQPMFSVLQMIYDIMRGYIKV